MPLVSLIDTHGQRVPFSELEATYTPDRWGVPLPLLKALARQKRPYADITVTELVASPQMRLLKQRHEYAADPADLIWRSFGTALHTMLELRSEPAAIAEQQLVADFDVSLPGGAARRVRLGGTADHYSPDAAGGTITNYKTASVYKACLLQKKGSSAALDWTAAENCYAYLLRRYGFTVEKIQLCLILKDWSIRERDRRGASFFCSACNRYHLRGNAVGHKHLEFADPARDRWYPPSQVFVFELPVWGQETAERYIRQRLELHLAAEARSDKELPACSDVENWKGRRCLRWCEVSRFCHQLRREPPQSVRGHCR